MRADAIRNRDQILEAGAAVFRESGLSVTLDAVIARAGVGRATFYRNFPHRTALVVALVEDSFRQLEDVKANTETDGQQLFHLLSQVGANLVSNPVLSDAWRFLGTGSTEKRALESKLQGFFVIPIRNAIAAGTLRADFTCADIMIVIGMLGTIASHQKTENRKFALRRSIELITSGINGDAVLVGKAGPL